MYSNACLYVSASELEGLPLTLLEAMSYGIPTLVSNIPPHIEVIGNNEEYGYSFDSANINSIKEKLEFILSQPEIELIKKGLKGQEKIRLHHNWENITKKLEIAYKLTRQTFPSKANLAIRKLYTS